MTVRFELPVELERSLRLVFVDLDKAVKEAALVEFYRQGKLTRYELSRGLGLSRYETDGVLKKHHVTEDLLTVEEFNRQVDDVQRLMGPATPVAPSGL